MKHLLEQIQDHIEKLVGGVVGLSAGVAQVSKSIEVNIDWQYVLYNWDLILLKLTVVAVLAFVGGIFGGLAKWLIDNIKDSIKKKKHEQKR